MNFGQLTQIENLQIENEHGSILFLGPTDITSIDLGSLVTITKGNAEVYPDGAQKPNIGEKLNKEVQITLKNISKGKRTAEQYE